MKEIKPISDNGLLLCDAKYSLIDCLLAWFFFYYNSVHAYIACWDTWVITHDYPLRSVTKKLEWFKISTVIDEWKIKRNYVVFALRCWIWHYMLRCETCGFCIAVRTFRIRCWTCRSWKNMPNIEWITHGQVGNAL